MIVNNNTLFQVIFIFENQDDLESANSDNPYNTNLIKLHFFHSLLK